MSKTVVVMLGVLCLVVGSAAYGVIEVAGKLVAELHRSALALDALASRVAAVEQDLSNISEDVYAMADDVAAIADSLAVEEDDEPDGEAVGLRAVSQSGAARPRPASGRLDHARARGGRRAQVASVVARRLVGTRDPAVTTAH